MRQIISVLLFVFCLKAVAVTHGPKHVYLHAECSGPLGSEIVTSLRDSIRASAGYELVNRLDDDGGYGVVVTIYMVCAEQRAPSGEQYASVASIFGRATCIAGGCEVTSDEASQAASLCSGSSGPGCGKDLYTSLDQYMSGSGGQAFDLSSEIRRKNPQ